MSKDLKVIVESDNTGIIKYKKKEIGKIVCKNSTVCQIFQNYVIILDPSLIDKKFNIQEYWINIPLNNETMSRDVYLCAEYGYSHPYITDKTPFNDTIPISIAMILTPKEKNNIHNCLNEAMYVISQYDSDTCHLSCVFDTETIKILKKIPESGGMVCEKQCSQKEVAGELYVHKMENNVAIISIDSKSLSHGKEQEVSVGRSKINFHTHPKQAYKDNGVKKAWPSSTDYLGYLGLGKHTMFHCVITLEGIYIISFTSNWVDKLDKIDKSFIKNNFNVSHNSSMSILEYVDHINTIKYQNHPIYHLKFVPWEKAHSIFSVNYAKDNGNCFYSDKHKKKIASLHK